MTEELDSAVTAQVPLHLVRQLPIEGERINVSVSENGSVAAVSTREIKAFAPDGTELFKLNAWTGSPHGSIAWSPDGEWIGVGTTNGIFQVIDGKKGRIAYGCRLGHMYDCLNITWFKDVVCASVVTGESVIVDSNNWNEVARFKQSLSPRVLSLEITNGEATEVLMETAGSDFWLHSKGGRQKTEMAGGRIHDFHPTTGVSLAWDNRTIGLLVRKGNQVIGGCPNVGGFTRVSPDGRFVAQWWTHGGDYGVVVHDTKTRKVVLALKNDEYSGLNSHAAFSPNSKFLAVGGNKLALYHLPSN